MNLPLRNTLITTNNVEAILNNFNNLVSRHNLKTFGSIDKIFTIDLSREIIKETMKSTYDVKYILLIGKSFKLEAQNALLKVLEETPLNIVLVFIADNKDSIIPTVRSRLYKEYIKIENKERIVKDTFNYSEMTDKNMTNILLKNKRITRDDLSKIIEDVIILESRANTRRFDLKELDKLTNMLKLLKLNSPPQNIMAYFLLLLNSVYKRYNKL